jgi:hypothetical protein
MRRLEGIQQCNGDEVMIDRGVQKGYHDAFVFEVQDTLPYYTTESTPVKRPLQSRTEHRPLTGRIVKRHLATKNSHQRTVCHAHRRQNYFSL